MGAKRGDSQRDDSYDSRRDPDADPEMVAPERTRPQPDQAEGSDDPAETGQKK
jgi:hypothetical protein